MGRGLDRLTHRANPQLAMPTVKRGEPSPINQALNKPRAKLGLELSTWLIIVFFVVSVFLVGFRFVAIISFPVLAGGAWLIVRKHPRMFQLWGLSLSQKSYYDPRKS
jgi:type IV secretory pathway VirB3-like protein